MKEEQPMSPQGHCQPCPVWVSSSPGPALSRLLRAASSRLSLPCQGVGGLRIVVGVT